MRDTLHESMSHKMRDTLQGPLSHKMRDTLQGSLRIFLILIVNDQKRQPLYKSWLHCSRVSTGNSGIGRVLSELDTGRLGGPMGRVWLGRTGSKKFVALAGRDGSGHALDGSVPIGLGRVPILILADWIGRVKNWRVVLDHLVLHWQCLKWATDSQ